MGGHNVFYIRAAAVGDFSIFSVDNRMEGVVLRKMFINKGKELFPEVCFECQIEWGAEVDSISVSVFSFFVVILISG